MGLIGRVVRDGSDGKYRTNLGSTERMRLSPALLSVCFSLDQPRPYRNITRLRGARRQRQRLTLGGVVRLHGRACRRSLWRLKNGLKNQRIKAKIRIPKRWLKIHNPKTECAGRI